MEHRITVTINGQFYELDVPTNRLLIDLLREDLHLMGTKEGCGEGECGACTVLLNGKPVTSCLILAAHVDGGNIVTIEGLAEDGVLDPLQASFISEGAAQCGYCTPGMIMTAKELLNENPRPTEDEIKEALAGNLCRCTGYSAIVRAVRSSAEGG